VPTLQKELLLLLLLLLLPSSPTLLVEAAGFLERLAQLSDCTSSHAGKQHF